MYIYLFSANKFNNDKKSDFKQQQENSTSALKAENNDLSFTELVSLAHACHLHLEMHERYLTDIKLAKPNKTII